MQYRIFHKIPVPYIINQSYFCGLKLYIDNRVLIPRSPISELINNNFLPWIKNKKIKRILDIGTGSGCIAIACSYIFKSAIIDVVDISCDALEVAKINCNNYKLNNRINIIQSNCWNNIQGFKYDLIISNPPYVAKKHIAILPKEYSYEPKIALQASKMGISIIEQILVNAHNFLNIDGILIVETGHNKKKLMKYFPKLPFIWIDIQCKNNGIFLLTYEILKSYFIN